MVEWDVKKYSFNFGGQKNLDLIGSVVMNHQIKHMGKPYRIVHKLCKKPWQGKLAEAIRINKDTLACQVCGTEMPKDIAEGLKKLRDFANNMEVLEGVKL